MSCNCHLAVSKSESKEGPIERRMAVPNILEAAELAGHRYRGMSGVRLHFIPPLPIPVNSPVLWDTGKNSKWKLTSLSDSRSGALGPCSATTTRVCSAARF